MKTQSRKIEIVPISTPDLPRVETLARRIWPECFAHLLTTEQLAAMLDAIYAPAVLERDRCQAGHVFWLAQVDGMDAGFAAAYTEGKRLWVRKLYVCREFRALGLGKRLIAAACEHFSEATQLGLNVNADNASAIAFYNSQGFTVEQRVPVTMGPYDFEDFIMVREGLLTTSAF